MKNTYIVTDNAFLRSGLIELAQESNITIQTADINEPTFIDALEKDDAVIVHIDRNTPAEYFDYTARINEKCRLMLVLNNPNLIYICDASVITTSRSSLKELMRAVNVLMSNKTLENQLRVSLSAKEKIILRETMNGQKVEQIAKVLNMSPKTVYTHRANVFSKLGGSSVNAIYSLKNRIMKEMAA
jgi:DNA-binding CsgD family transcriptional regulator